MKKAVEIETLLRWAAAEEWPKDTQVTRMVERITLRNASRFPHADYIFRRFCRDAGGYDAHRDALTIARNVHSVRVELGLLGETTAIALPAVELRIDLAFVMIACAVLKSRPFLNPNHPRHIKFFAMATVDG